jgi:hypothetical protein
VAGGIAAACLAGAMALGINMGILGAAGTPAGPGTLGGRVPLPAVGTPHPRPEAAAGPARARPGPAVARPGAAGTSPGAPGRARPRPVVVPPSAVPGDPEHEFGAGDDD